MQPQRDLGHAYDMLLASRAVHSFITGRQAGDLLSDRQLRDAVEKELEIVGEAVRRISDGFKLSHANVPWRRIAGLRNVLIHEYREVDLDELWRIATVEISPLIEQLGIIFAQQPDA